MEVAALSTLSMQNQECSQQDARRHVLSHGWNSTCYQVLNEGIEHWWSPDRSALVGFVRSSGMAIVAGAPVCAPERLRSTVQAWEEHAAQLGLRVCYFGAEARLQDLLIPSPQHVAVVLGSQPEWRPDRFSDTIERNHTLRAQLHRATNKGVSVTEWGRDKAEGNPTVSKVLHDWLRARGLPKLHFLVESETLSNLRDRRLFVAEQGCQPVGFVTLCPVPARNGWLTEQFVRGPYAPNGTVESMLYRAARTVADEGSEYFTMGIIPLISPDRFAFSGEPAWLRFLRRWAKAHYTRFYNFRGLSEFKSKFEPEKWQPVVVIVKDKKFGIRHLRSIGGAFTRGMPELALGSGLVKAVATELSRLARSGSPP